MRPLSLSSGPIVQPHPRHDERVGLTVCHPPAIVAAISVSRTRQTVRTETIQQVHRHVSATAAAGASAPARARSGEPIISARDVVKRYGETVAVAGLDLTIWPG